MEAATALARASSPEPAWPVIDLFSGAGGMSYGFHAHPSFRLAGAADGELGKPSTGFGHLECNSTYRANFGLAPVAVDLATITPSDLRSRMLGTLGHADARVLISCAPCTGFSRARSINHTVDDPRNGLVGRAVDFAEVFRPSIILLENARELITGRFSAHYARLRERLEAASYRVHGAVHMLSRFGLPQQRERALVIAVQRDLPLRTLDDLWRGYRIKPAATTVRRAIAHLPAVQAGVEHPDDAMHVSTAFGEPLSLQRTRAMPDDGGSWPDLYRDPTKHHLLTENMWRAVRKRRLNTHCDAYGRLAWERPAPTIKRECCHVGNGRYTHPEQDRLCTIREMANLQGFPRSFMAEGKSRKNRYRQIGDAVPPLISFQLAHLCSWILTDVRPKPEELLLPGTHLVPEDIEPLDEPLRLIED
jgi:DNA (cytosine-5)-methyltransferase 1